MGWTSTRRERDKAADEQQPDDPDADQQSHVPRSGTESRTT